MKVSLEVKGQFKDTKNFLQSLGKFSAKKAERLAKMGTEELKKNTPVDTGETRDGWRHSVKTTKNSLTIEWTNNAHPESPVNVAKLIHFGHYTRSGGYVPPTNFITHSLKDVLKVSYKDVSEAVKIK